MLSASVWNKDEENGSRFLEGCEHFFCFIFLFSEKIMKLNMLNSSCAQFFTNISMKKRKHVSVMESKSKYHLSRS